MNEMNRDLHNQINYSTPIISFEWPFIIIIYKMQGTSHLHDRQIFRWRVVETLFLMDNVLFSLKSIVVQAIV